MSGERSALEWEGVPVETLRVRWGVPAVHAYERVGSTNDVARDLAEAGAPAGTVVLAELQSAGRGRGGKHWHAPAGTALLVSIVLRPRASGAPGALPLRVGLAVARAIERVAGIRAGVKWPNDIVVAGHGKVAGVLCEGALTAHRAPFVVAGIGLNVAQRAEDFPAPLRAAATSLRSATGAVISRSELAGAIIGDVRVLADRGGALESGLLEELAARDVLRGHAITIDGAPAGTAVGIDPDGSLLVRGEHGDVRPVRNGTVRIDPQGTVAEGLP